MVTLWWISDHRKNRSHVGVGATTNALGTAAMPITSFIMSGLAAFLSVGVLYLSCAALTIVLFLVVGMKKLEFE